MCCEQLHYLRVPLHVASVRSPGADNHPCTTRQILQPYIIINSYWLIVGQHYFRVCGA